MPPLRNPLVHPEKFSLNTAGLAGVFGGDEAISAMETVHLYRGRRWLGWFNSPGSFTVAKRFGRIANSRFWNGLFPGPKDPPTISLGLDGVKGPRYISGLTETMDTGHLAFLAVERSKEINVVELGGRVTMPLDVTYLAMNNVNYDAPIEKLPVKAALCGLIPITISLVACEMCALVFDWTSFFVILIGIVSNGLANFFIGGELVFDFVREPAERSTPGHGILMGEDGVVVVKGKERDVNAITIGRFVLKTDLKLDDFMKWLGRGDAENQHNTENGHDGRKGEKRPDKKRMDEEHCHTIGIYSLALLVQLFLQLLLIPQGTLFGQIMFLVSLGASWLYNSYLSSLEKERIQAKMLFKNLGNPQMRRFRAGTRTTMAVFACLLLFHGVQPSSQVEGDTNYRIWVLREFLPNKIGVWRSWRERVAKQLLNLEDSSLSHLTIAEADPKLLKTLLGDARTAFEEYFKIREALPPDSTTQH